MTRPGAAAGALAVLLAACSGTPAPAPPAGTPASVPATAAASPTRPAPRPRVPRCPAVAPVNGPLTDQGERVGKVGASSQTYDDPGRAGVRYCVAVLSVVRSGVDAVVTVEVANRGGVPVDVGAGVDKTVVELAYGSVPAERDFAPADAVAVSGVVPPAGSLTGRWAFTVPPGRWPVAVSAGPAGAEGVWVGAVG